MLPTNSGPEVLFQDLRRDEIHGWWWWWNNKWNKSETKADIQTKQYNLHRPQEIYPVQDIAMVFHQTSRHHTLDKHTQK